MDRNIVYPSSIPLDTDLLSINKNTMIGLGFLAQAVLGTNTIADGMQCQPTSPASMNVVVGPGSVTQMCPIDMLAYGSIPADPTDLIIKMGINTGSTTFGLTAPSSVGSLLTTSLRRRFRKPTVTQLRCHTIIRVIPPSHSAAHPIPGRRKIPRGRNGCSCNSKQGFQATSAAKPRLQRIMAGLRSIRSPCRTVRLR